MAADLERRWNEALLEHECLQREHRRFEQSQPRELTAEQTAQIERLSHDIPALWHHPETTSEDRQIIARILLERVTVTVEDDSENVDGDVRFAGGFVSRITHRRPVQTYDQHTDFPEIIKRIEQLKTDGLTAAAIVTQLNADGYVPAKRAKRFSGAMVNKLLQRQQTRAGERSVSQQDRCHLKPNEWWLSNLAAELTMPPETLHRWRRVGWVNPRKIADAGGKWALFADDTELLRLSELRAYRRSWRETKTPSRLTTPVIINR